SDHGIGNVRGRCRLSSHRIIPENASSTGADTQFSARGVPAGGRTAILSSGATSMARRGLAILFTLLGIAFFVSIVGFGLLYLAFGREPSVASNSTLVLRVGGNLTEVAPADVVSYVRGVKLPTVRSVVESLRKAKVDGRV